MEVIYRYKDVEKTGIPFRSVARYVNSLREKNRIVRIGGDKGGYYQALPDGGSEPGN